MKQLFVIPYTRIITIVSLKIRVKIIHFNICTILLAYLLDVHNFTSEFCTKTILCYSVYEYYLISGCISVIPSSFVLPSVHEVCTDRSQTI